MIFLGNLTVVDSTKSQVGMIHNMPFDSVNGMGMAQAQLEAIGILVDSMPAENPPIGQMTAGIFVNPSTKEVAYEYSTPPKTQEQINADLQAQNAQMLLALVNGGLL